MPSFKFKLKTVHNLKRQFEDQAKNKLMAALTVYNRERGLLERIYETIEFTIAEFRRLSGGKFRAGKIRDFNYFLTTMKEKARVQQEVVDEAQAAVDRARSELVIAAQQREMYDKLRERAYAQYIVESKRSEQLVIDELVSYRGNSLA